MDASNLITVGFGAIDKGMATTLNKITLSAHNAGKATEHFERTTKNLTNTLKGVGAYFSTRELIRYADTWRLIGARVGVVTDTTEQQITVQRRLYEISQRTRNTLAATSVLYTRVGLNADQLGRSHEDLLRVTESVNAAMLISGATGVEAAQSMRQLAQALGSGRVQGDEFRTMMEAMPLVSRAVADEMGVAVEDLYTFSEKGLISVQTVIDALLKKNEELVAQAEAMPWTVGQVIGVATNALTRITGIMNEAYDVTGRLGRGIIWVSDRFEILFAIIAGATTYLITYRGLIVSLNAVMHVWQNRAKGVALMEGLLTGIVKNKVQIIATLVAATAAYIAYLKVVEDIEAKLAEFDNADADLFGLLGEGAERLNKEAEKIRDQIEDIYRLAAQDVVIASLSDDRAIAEMQIEFEYINASIEASRKNMEGLGEEMQKALEYQKKSALWALELETAIEEITDQQEEFNSIIERFSENLQRSMARTFRNIFKDGIDSFGDLFDAIKDMFLNLLAEMAAARVMQAFGSRLEETLSDAFGGQSYLAEMEDLLNSYRREGEIYLPAARGEVQQPETGAASLITASNTELNRFGEAIAAGIAGFGLGGAVGMASGGNTILGALGGAGAGALAGSAFGPVGIAIGGLSGAIGGLIGSMEEERKEQALHRQALKENSKRLQELRDQIYGGNATRFLDANSAVDRMLRYLEAGATDLSQYPSDPFADFPLSNLGQLITDQRALAEVAEELGITYDHTIETLMQLQEAIKLNVLQLTTFGKNYSDVQRRNDAFNKIFDIPEDGINALRTSFFTLAELAPDLLKQFDLYNLNLDSPEAREALNQGFRDIFKFITAGELANDPALLGAFEDKNQLLDAILRTKDALVEFQKVIFDVTTDFPRAQDIAYYEQTYGKYGTGPGGGTFALPGGGGSSSGDIKSFIIDTVNITNNSDDDGEALLRKLEGAVQTRQARGGGTTLEASENILF